MLVTLNEVLRDARKNHYAVGLFNTVNLEMIQGVFAAAEEAKSPIVVGTAEILLPVASLKMLIPLLLQMAREATVPVVVHMDHALTVPCLEEAMALGVSSVMYDCSALPYEQNAGRVGALVKKAHAKGITVEAELGHVGSGDGLDSGTLTRPEEAARYIAETGVDALAVAIGSAHGIYKSKPHLDLPRLEAIAAATPLPLVLHGGSGLTDDDFRAVIARGISKVNIFTDLCQAGAKASYEGYKPGIGIFDQMPSVIQAVKQTTLARMEVFGSVNKG